MARRLGLLLLFIAFAVAVANVPQLAGRAFAAGLDAKGKADAKEATQLYKQGLYEEAAQIFARLSVDYPDMQIFERNVGACFYYLRKPEPALSNLRNYLNHNKDIGPDDKTVVDRWIDEMEKLRAQNAATGALVGQPRTKTSEVSQSGQSAVPSSAAPVPTEMANQPAGVDLAAGSAASETGKPIYKTWWFWTGAAAVVAAGTVTAILLARRSSDPCDGASLACMGVK